MPNRMRPNGLLIFALALFGAAALRAQSVPGTMNFQGRLTDNSPEQAPITATVPMSFGIWDSPIGGTRVWRGPDPAGPGCAGVTAIDVPVEKGIFSIQLGASCTPLSQAVFSASSRYVEITLNPGLPNEEVLAPRLLLSSVGFAQKAENANVASSAFDTAQLGGVWASGYLLTTGTAADSSLLGGVPPNGWQRALSPSNCQTGQVLTGIAQNGAPSCEDKTEVLAPLNLSMMDNTGAILTVNSQGSSPATTMFIDTTGTGTALQAAIANPASPSAALFGKTNGSGPAVRGLAQGSGSAGTFETQSASSPATTVSVANAGTGSAGVFAITNAASLAPAVAVTSAGLGPVLQLDEFNSSALGPVIKSSMHGPGTNVLLDIVHPGAKGLVINSYPGQTGNLMEWYGPPGPPLGSISASGVLSGDGSGLTNVDAKSLQLPFSRTTTAAIPAFETINGGSGAGGRFVSSGGNALVASASGASASAVTATHSGNPGGTGSLATNGAGVYGHAAADGKNGVYGDDYSPSGSAGVRGYSLNGTGTVGVGDYAGVEGMGTSFGVRGNGAVAGVYGNGPSRGVHGVGDIYGVYGSTPIQSAVGVFGTNTHASSGYGVMGQVTSGQAVFGDATSGWGVHGKSSSNYGVFGESATGSGVVGQTASASDAGVIAVGSGSTGTALQIESGAIKVLGAGENSATAVFRLTNVAASCTSAITTINNSMVNNNPNAILFIQGNTNSGFYATYGVCTAGRWSIVRADSGNIAGLSFNVLVFKP